MKNFSSIPIVTDTNSNGMNYPLDINNDLNRPFTTDDDRPLPFSICKNRFLFELYRRIRLYGVAIGIYPKQVIFT